MHALKSSCRAARRTCGCPGCASRGRRSPAGGTVDESRRPCSRRAASSSRRVGDVAREGPQRGPTGMTTVAVVEDNADNRLLLQALLGERYDLVEFDNGVGCAGGTGGVASRSGAARHLASRDGRERDPRAESAGTSGSARYRSSPSRRTRCPATARSISSAGFNDYITKPIVDETLLFEAIERWLGEALRRLSTCIRCDGPVRRYRVERKR